MINQDGRQPDRLGGEDNISTADLAGRHEEGEVARSSDADRLSGERDAEPLFPTGEAQDLRGRWDTIQAGFVDEPRRAVQEADSLVAAAMKRLAETFADERQALEAQWDRGDDVSTEDLRLALRRYRSFFGRLLSM
jgi:hypothetical protein